MAAIIMVGTKSEENKHPGVCILKGNRGAENQW